MASYQGGYQQSGGYPYSQPPPAQGPYGQPPPAGYPTSTAAYASASHPTAGYGSYPIAGGKQEGQQAYGFDVEAQYVAGAAATFAEIKIRSAFVRKVFILVFMQLALTIGVACVFMFVNPVKEYVAGTTDPCPFNPNLECYTAGDGRWVFYTSWALTLVTLIALMCSTTLRRRVPWNYLAMITFTVVMSVQVGCIVAFWDVSVVLIAFAVTGASVLGLTLAAVFIPWDITKKGNVLGMAALIVFFVALMTFIVGFFYVNKWWYLALSVVISLLFAAFLVYDVQMVMGRGKYKVSPDEYVFSAVQIYLDIVIMFLNILNVVGIASS